MMLHLTNYKFLKNIFIIDNGFKIKKNPFTLFFQKKYDNIILQLFAFVLVAKYATHVEQGDYNIINRY